MTTGGNPPQLPGESPHTGDCVDIGSNSFSCSTSSYNPRPRYRKGNVPHPLTDPQHRSLMTSQSSSLIRLDGFETSSKSASKAHSSSHIRDHQSWTENELKEFYFMLITCGSLKFKQMARLKNQTNENPGARFKNKWNGERMRAIKRGTTADCRTLAISVLNDYFQLLSKNDGSPPLAQEEREKFAPWVTDLISNLPLSSASNTSDQVQVHLRKIYDKFYPYRDRVDMLRVLYEGSPPPPPPPLSPVPPSVQTQVHAMNDAVFMPSSVSMSTPVIPSVSGPTLLQPSGNNANVRVGVGINVLSNGLQPNMQSTPKPILIGPISSTIGHSLQPVTLTNAGVGPDGCITQFSDPAGQLHQLMDLGYLSYNDLTLLLNNILSTPPYKDIIEFPLDLSNAEDKQKLVSAIIDRSEQLKRGNNPSVEQFPPASLPLSLQVQQVQQSQQMQHVDRSHQSYHQQHLHLHSQPLPVSSQQPIGYHLHSSVRSSMNQLNTHQHQFPQLVTVSSLPQNAAYLLNAPPTTANQSLSVSHSASTPYLMPTSITVPYRQDGTTFTGPMPQHNMNQCNIQLMHGPIPNVQEQRSSSTSSNSVMKSCSSEPPTFLKETKQGKLTSLEAKLQNADVLTKLPPNGVQSTEISVINRDTFVEAADSLNSISSPKYHG